MRVIPPPNENYANISSPQRAISARRPGACYLRRRVRTNLEDDDDTSINATSDDPPVEEDELHTLSAYGEIPSENVYFIPSAATDASPSKRSIQFEPGKPAFPRNLPRLAFSRAESVRVLAHLGRRVCF